MGRKVGMAREYDSEEGVGSGAEGGVGLER